ncbi:hypothetical protein EDB62_10353 [Vibrio crassostreae]|nr:hypothetical protein EDB62_10353 [Vibrio crassostreae]
MAFFYPVVLYDLFLQIPNRTFHIRDLKQSRFCYQPILEGIEGLLYTSLSLRQVGENNFDTEFVTSTLHLKEVLHVFFERFWDLIG